MRRARPRSATRLLPLTAIAAAAIAVAATLAAPAAPPAPELRQAPRPLPPASVGVGRLAPDLAFADLGGRAHRLSDFRNAKAVVVALTSSSCPVSRKLAPALARAEATYAPRGVRFVFLAPVATDTAADLKALAKAHGLRGPVARDASGSLAKSLGATTTTEVFVLDAARTLTYRGAVSDQYGVAYARDAARDAYLERALDAVLAGDAPTVAATEAPGCTLDFGDAKPAGDAPTGVTVTYHNRVSRLMDAHCVSCHRDGGVAPFPLDTYAAVKAHAGMIRTVVEEKRMPPWFASPTPEGHPSPWANDRSLPRKDRDDLLAWLTAADKPEGDPKEAPLPRRFAAAAEGGWTVGKPDAVFALPKPIPVKAEGTMPYQNVNVPTNFTEDRWVRKIEVLPGDRRVVHHVLVFARSPESAEAAEGTGGGRLRERIGEGAEELNGFFGIYVPGNSALTYPDGLAKRIPKGSVLRFQIHYTPNGTATTDRTKIGLVFAKEPPQSEVHTASIANLRFAIPPGADHHEVVGQLRAPTDVRLLSFLPHMHVRGKAARYELTSAAGRTTTLLDVPRYDFNWQLNYVLSEPLDVRAGEQVTFRAWYDNSAKNPANPDPAKTVRWGAQTFDEMHLGYVEYIVPGQKPGEGGGGLRRRPGALLPGAGVGARRGSAPGGGGAAIEATFRRLDRDGDGFLTEAEAPALWERIRNADANGDGRISREEATRFFTGGRE